MSPKHGEGREALIKLCWACAPGNQAGMDSDGKEALEKVTSEGGR